VRTSGLLLLAGALFLSACSSDDERSKRRDEPAPGPEVTENDPGTLAITSPARGAFLTPTADGLITVEGTGATAALQVGGQPVSPAADGSFVATVPATYGLTLIRVVDGTSAIDVPVLYGNYAPSSATVPQAIAFQVNGSGFFNEDPNRLSLTLLADRALGDVDLLAGLQGQTYSGSSFGADWQFDVWGTQYSVATVELVPHEGGISFYASVGDVFVDGTLTVTVLGVGPSGDVTLSATSAEVVGELELYLDDHGAVHGWVPRVDAWLNGFAYDSGNAGFPCCVDSIMTGILEPKVQDAAREGVEARLAEDVAFALSQLSLPSSLDLAALGLPAVVGIDKVFDGVGMAGGSLSVSAAARFHHPMAPDDPGSSAPGWLVSGSAPGPLPTSSSFGMSVSLDALNQALFVAWGQGGLEMGFDTESVGHVTLAPRLPPVVLPNGKGGLTAAAGEVVADFAIGGNPVKAAFTIIDDVTLAIDPATRGIALVPSGAPQISITWLEAQGIDPVLLQLVAEGAMSKLPALLAPMTLPLPSIPLGAIASTFGDATGAIAPGSQVLVDSAASRLTVLGDFEIVW
jgi:hypothetical protein